MKVAIVCHRYFPHRGGVETHVQRIVERLAPQGVRLEVITTDPTRRLRPVEHINGIVVRRFPSFAPGEAYYLSLAQLAWLRRHRADYDLIHGHCYEALTCLNAGLASNAVPFLFTPHYHGRGTTRVRDVLHVPYRLVGRWLFGRAQRIICVSNAELELLSDHFPAAAGKAVVIPNGIELDGLRAAETLPKNGRLILTVGRLERYKNVHRVVQALEYLPSDYNLLIVGAGPYGKTLDRLVNRLGLATRVRMVSDLDSSQLYRFYRTADLCVALSEHEAFGITVLEALAAGRPVLANEIAAFREAQRLSRSVQLVNVARLGDRDLAHSIRQAMSWRGEPVDLTDYSWDRVAERTLNVYREVLGSRMGALA